MDIKFVSDAFLPYEKYAGLRSNAIKRLRKIALPCFILFLIGCCSPFTLPSSFLIVGFILLFTAIIIFLTSLPYLSGKKKPVDKETYDRYIHNYYVRITDDKIIISRSNCLNNSFTFKRYYGFMKDYKIIDGVPVEVRIIPRNSIQEIRLVGQSLSEDNTGNVYYLLEIISNQDALAETNTDKKSVQQYDFIIPTHFDREFLRKFEEIFSEKINYSADKGSWEKVLEYYYMKNLMPGNEL